MVFQKGPYLIFLSDPAARPSSVWSLWEIRFRFRAFAFSVAQAFTPGAAKAIILVASFRRLLLL
jgi:hypothetical protein